MTNQETDLPGQNEWLHRFAVVVACSTLVLIFVGGLVTSTGSGLAVPDWPLSYGRFFPPMVGGVLFEHGHRMVAAAVGILTIALAVWIWRMETRKWVRRLGILAVFVVVSQGVLGGITVLYLLPTAVSVAHAALAEIFLCINVSLALVTSKTWRRERILAEDVGLPSLRTLTAATTGLIYIQILIGAWMRHTSSGLAIPDFPLSFGHLVPPHFTYQIALNYAHRIGAAIVATFIFWTVSRVMVEHHAEAALRNSAGVLLLTLGLQLLLGAEAVWTSRATLITTLHVAGGAITLAASLLLTLTVHRVLSPRPLTVGAALERTNRALEHFH